LPFTELPGWRGAMDSDPSSLPRPSPAAAIMNVKLTRLGFGSETASELDIPRSGVEPLADKMPLPRTLDPAENDSMLYFVAENAVRRLMNRIHSSLYSADHPELAVPGTRSTTGKAGAPKFNLNKLLTLGYELNRQLEEWYNSIPSTIRPSIGPDPVLTERGLVLRLRYYAARHIIHRPFVLYAVLRYQAAGTLSPPAATSPLATFADPNAPAARVNALPTQVVLDMCSNCITSCQAFMLNARDLLQQRSPYVWTFTQNCLACMLVLLLADSCPPLRPLTPDPKPLRDLLVTALRACPTRGSSFHAAADILENLDIPDRFNP
jgi:hypothetical protein